MAPRTPRVWRMSAGAVFLATWAVVLILGVCLAVIGINVAGSPTPFRDWLTAVTPYALVWRLAIYVGGGTLYGMRLRPRLRALQRRQADGGEAAHDRLRRIERLVVIVFVAIEVANAPDLIAWIRG